MLLLYEPPKEHQESLWPRDKLNAARVGGIPTYPKPFKNMQTFLSILSTLPYEYARRAILNTVDVRLDMQTQAPLPTVLAQAFL